MMKNKGPAGRGTAGRGRGTAGRGRGTSGRGTFPTKFYGRGGRGQWSVRKPVNIVGLMAMTKAERKVEAFKMKLAAKGITYIPNYQMKKKQAPKAVKQEDGQSTSKGLQKSEEEQLYKQKMGIVPDPERKFEEQEIEKIQEAILSAFEHLESGCFPQFYGSYPVKGTLVMSCANEQTKDWLERIVPELQPWEGAKLRIKAKGEVAQGSKVLLKTPKLFAKTDPTKILQMLSTQNKTLQTNTWKNVSAKSEASGQTLIYIVDNTSLEAIRALENKVYLGLGNVELVILEDKKDDDESGDKKDDNEGVKKEEEEEKEDDGDDSGNKKHDDGGDGDKNDDDSDKKDDDKKPS